MSVVDAVAVKLELEVARLSGELGWATVRQLEWQLQQMTIRAEKAEDAVDYHLTALAGSKQAAAA